MTDPAWEPPLAGSDVDHLVGTLERLRATFRWKADGLDVGRWQFTVDPDETAEGVYELWAAAVGRSRARLQELVDDGGLDQPGHLEFSGERPSVRRHLHDLIEEYGRHTGHMDLLREAIDGRVGEDPPADWPMIPAP